MKLAKYLADYIEHEREVSMTGDIGHKMEEIIQQGIEAFESTEAVKVLVVNEPEICKGCSESVAQGSGRFINRVLHLDGGFTCSDCDEKLRG